MKREIKSIDAGSMAKTFAYVYGALGTVYGIIIALLSLIAPGLLGFGLMMAVLIIIFMIVFGAIFGFVAALAYNFGAKWWGGVKLEVK